jgi:hypothetical protein
MLTACGAASLKNFSGYCSRISRNYERSDVRSAACPTALKSAGARVSTAAKMAICRWLDPFQVARVNFLEWTPEGALARRLPTRRTDSDCRAKSAGGALTIEERAHLLPLAESGLWRSKLPAASPRRRGLRSPLLTARGHHLGERRRGGLAISGVASVACVQDVLSRPKR